MKFAKEVLISNISSFPSPEMIKTPDEIMPSKGSYALASLFSCDNNDVVNSGMFFCWPYTSSC